MADYQQHKLTEVYERLTEAIKNIMSITDFSYSYEIIKEKIQKAYVFKSMNAIKALQLLSTSKNNYDRLL